MPKRVEDDTKPLASRELHGWDKITVAGSEHDRLDDALHGEGRHVQTDSQIHALLADVRNEVRGLQGTGASQEFVLNRRPYLPPVKHGFTAAQREPRRDGQRLLESQVPRMARVGRQIREDATERIALRAPRGRGIVVIHAEERRGGRSEQLELSRWDRDDVRWGRESPEHRGLSLGDEPAIQKNRDARLVREVARNSSASLSRGARALFDG